MNTSARTATRLSNYFESTGSSPAAFPALTGTQYADVCVVGGGIAGCSTALHLAQYGYTVALLEAHQIGWGASGRCGGQVMPGLSCDQSDLDSLIERADADAIWQTSVEAVQLVRDLIAAHSIPCDWQVGLMKVAANARQNEHLLEWQNELVTRYRYNDTRYVDSAGVGALLATNRYCGGLLDNASGHLHPLNYTRGLAEAASRTGKIAIFEQSKVIEVRNGLNPVVRTQQGEVKAKFVVLCGNAYLGDLVPRISSAIIPTKAYIIATEPLDAATATIAALPIQAT
jgi:gamma-glutamylputrescine oxidase